MYLYQVFFIDIEKNVVLGSETVIADDEKDAMLEMNPPESYKALPKKKKKALLNNLGSYVPYEIQEVSIVKELWEK